MLQVILRKPVWMKYILSCLHTLIVVSTSSHSDNILDSFVCAREPHASQGRRQVALYPKRQQKFYFFLSVTCWKGKAVTSRQVLLCHYFFFSFLSLLTLSTGTLRWSYFREVFRDCLKHMGMPINLGCIQVQSQPLFLSFTHYVCCLSTDILSDLIENIFSLL